MEIIHLYFHTLEEAQKLSQFIAQRFPDPERVLFGILEIAINAVEHGNLEITYDEKNSLLREGRWQEEIQQRLHLYKNRNKAASITYIATRREITIRIKDQGKGFNWMEYIDIAPDRLTTPNGRGIALARMMSFDHMEYLGVGNEVVGRVYR